MFLIRSFKGDILIYSVFVGFVITVVLFALFSVIKWKFRTVQMQEVELRAKYAASSGISEAIYDLKQTPVWKPVITRPEFWQAEANGFFSVNTEEWGASYPLTVNVKVDGDVYAGKFSILSEVELESIKTDPVKRSSQVSAVRSVIGDIIIMSSFD